jgi:hypothetical protein
MSNYDGSIQRIRPSGGSVRVTLSGGVGQGNAGTSLPCAGCWVQPVAANTSPVKMNISAAASASLGVDLQRPHINDGTDEYGAAAAQPLWVPISDLSELYFYSAQATAVVDITYLTD